MSAWTVNTMEQHKIHRRLVEAGVAVVTDTAVLSHAGDTAMLACTYTGRERSIACDALVTVTLRMPDDQVLHDLHALGFARAQAIGDADCPGTIAEAVHSGRLYAEELHAPARDRATRRSAARSSSWPEHVGRGLPWLRVETDGSLWCVSPLSPLASPLAADSASSIVTVTPEAMTELAALRDTEPDADRLGLRLEIISQPGEDFKYDLSFDVVTKAAFTDEVRTTHHRIERHHHAEGHHPGHQPRPARRRHARPHRRRRASSSATPTSRRRRSSRVSSTTTRSAPRSRPSSPPR